MTRPQYAILCPTDPPQVIGATDDLTKLGDLIGTNHGHKHVAVSRADADLPWNANTDVAEALRKWDRKVERTRSQPAHLGKDRHE